MNVRVLEMKFTYSFLLSKSSLHFYTKIIHVSNTKNKYLS
jgi:hypothetical protein